MYINKEKIEKMQYRNLRAGFQLLVDTILGKDYYNMSCDTYRADIETISDLINAYNKHRLLKKDNPFNAIDINDFIDKNILLVEVEICKEENEALKKRLEEMSIPDVDIKGCDNL